MDTLDPVASAITHEIKSLSNGFNSRYEIDQHLLQKGYAPTDIDAVWQNIQSADDAHRKKSNLVEFLTRPIVMLGITVLLGLLILLNYFLRPFEDRTYTTIVAPQMKEASLKTTAFSPNGKYLSSINSFGEVFIWELPLHRLVKTYNIQTPDNYIFPRIFWSADSQLMMVSNSNTTQIFRIETNTEVFSQKTLKPSAPAAFSPNGRFIVHNPKPNQLSIVDIVSGTEVKTIIGNWRESYAIRSLQFSPDNKFVAVELPDRMWFWDTETDHTFYIQRNLNGYQINGYSFSPDGKYLALNVIEDKSLKIQLWQWRNNLLVKETGSGYPSTFKPVFSADGEWLIVSNKTISSVGGYEGEVAQLLQISNFKSAQASIDLRNMYVDDLDFSPDGKTLVITSYNKLLLRNISDLLK